MRHRTFFKTVLLFWICIMVPTLICCASNANGNINGTACADRSDSLIMKRSGSLHWDLDSSSVPNIKSLFFSESRNMLFCFNEMTWCIDGYDMHSGTKAVRYGVPAIMPWSMNVVSQDSIFVLDLDNSRITRLDSRARTWDDLAIDRTSTILPGSPGQPYVTDSVMIYVSSSDRLGFTTFIIDRKTGNISRHIPYPKSYRNFYGALLMQVPYSAFNPDEGLIVVGFPIDGTLYILDLNGRISRTVYAESIQAHQITPLRKGRWGLGVSSEEEIEYFRKVTSYGNILYDSYRNLYYRIVERSTPMPGVLGSNKAKSLSVIILDKNFRIVGESDLDDVFFAGFRYTCFVSKEGLNLQLLTSDDELAFATYTVTEKPNNH